MFGFELEKTVSVGDLIAAFTALLATAGVLFTLIGALFSLNRFRRTLEQGNRTARSAHYAELDRAYADLVAMVVTYPFLRSPKALESDEQALTGRYEPFPADSAERHQYEAYAHLVWCFVESVHDRCLDCEIDKGRSDMIETWATAISVENRIHRGWFLADMHDEEVKQLSDLEAGRPYDEAIKFRLGFRVFVLEGQWRTKDWEYRSGFSAPVNFGVG